MQNIIRTRLSILLEVTGWNLQELATKANLPFDTVKNLYYGRNDNPRIETLIAIANAFKVSLDYLVGRIDYASDGIKHLAILGTLDEDTKEIIELIVKRAIEKRAKS